MIREFVCCDAEEICFEHLPISDYVYEILKARGWKIVIGPRRNLYHFCKKHVSEAGDLPEWNSVRIDLSK